MQQLADRPGAGCASSAWSARTCRRRLVRGGRRGHVSLRRDGDRERGPRRARAPRTRTSDAEGASPTPGRARCTDALLQAGRRPARGALSAGARGAARTGAAARAAADLPLRHRMPRPTATARRSAVLILFGEGPRGPDVLLIEKSRAPAPARRPAGVPRRRGRPRRRLPRRDGAARGRGGGRASTRPACGCWPPCRSCSCRRRTTWSCRSWPGGTTRGTHRGRSGRGGPGGAGAAGRPGRSGQPVPGAAAVRVRRAGVRRRRHGGLGLHRRAARRDPRAAGWPPVGHRRRAPAARAGVHPAGSRARVDEDEDEDAAAPTVADPAPDGPPTRSVPGMKGTGALRPEVDGRRAVIGRSLVGSCWPVAAATPRPREPPRRPRPASAR